MTHTPSIAASSTSATTMSQVPGVYADEKRADTDTVYNVGADDAKYNDSTYDLEKREQPDTVPPLARRLTAATQASAADRQSNRSPPPVGSAPPGHGLTRRPTTLSRLASTLPNPEGDTARGPAPPRPPPKLNKYSYGFFSPEMAMFRGIVRKILIGAVVLTIIIMWLCAPLYWGSLWKADKYIDKLTVRIIDRDGGEIGQSVSAAFLNLTGKENLHYFHTPADEFPTFADVEHDIVQEGAWAAIVINEGATAALAQARATGDSSYMGTSAIELVISQARSEIAIGSYLLPSAQAALGAITARVSAQNVAEFLASNAGNATALGLLARAPTTLSNPVSYTLVNVRPYNQPVATAITLVGLIYMLIFSFIMTMANNGAREIIAPYLTTAAYIRYRVFMPLFLYLPVSFAFAMVNLPFKIHFGAHFTYAGGFFLWWFILYLGMAALGLTTEFLITLVGPKFMGFTLIPLIIANVSAGISVPHQLQPWIFRYGVAMPFYHCSRAVRTLIFNTKNELGLNCGVLIAWIALSLITMPLATWLMRRNAVNEHCKAVGEEEHDIVLPDGRVV